MAGALLLAALDLLIHSCLSPPSYIHFSLLNTINDYTLVAYFTICVYSIKN